MAKKSTATLNSKLNNDRRRIVSTLAAVTALLAVGETAAFLTPPSGSVVSRLSPMSEFSATPGRNSPSGHPHTSKLFYRDGMDSDGTGVDRKVQTKAAKSVRAKISSWWGNSAASSSDPPMETETRQEEVDRYLEFLDKRYHRLHDDEEAEPKQKQSKEEQKKFSMLDWLSAENPGDHIAEARKQNDALYVLGVAGLASERLLMKHQLIQPRPRRNELHRDGAIVIDAEVTPDATVRKVVEVSSVMLRQLSQRREALIRYQNMQMRKALRLSANTVIHAPGRLAKALWEIGGGKRTFALTVAMLTAAFILVRPIVAAILKTILYQNPTVA
eukprot:CAMPEP_0194047112 /NCGR_PEP_ID=MMETSP0009_2-20130614/23561_1 /TAXON_ID=210454 /ORGANISM="Grammatophora oceanica, Strain CCMP 410" /LENGTH=329 /DNA_ID=CAMNT_0038692629 /DNA_START=39 /DNA_END=1028 /DNA_ORIENTATION=+